MVEKLLTFAERQVRELVASVNKDGSRNEDKRDPVRKAERAKKRMTKKEIGAAKHEFANDLSSDSRCDPLVADASKHGAQSRSEGKAVAANPPLEESLSPLL